MKPVRVAADRWNFETAPGEYISPIGGNVLNDQHPVTGTLFDAFDADDVDRRLGAMAGVGLNCLRQPIGVNTVFDPATGLKADGLRNWDTFIGLCEKHGVYLMPVGGYVGGNDWFDVEKLADHGRSLDQSCAFWEAFVGHYAGHPAIWAWDLANELLYDTVEHQLAGGGHKDDHVGQMLKDRWPAHLEARYGTVETMNRVYGSDYNTFADVPGRIHFEEAPFDLRAYDFRNYLNERGYDWCKRNSQAIRSACPEHMIVSGNNTWITPDQDLWLANGFHNRAVEDLFDFVTFHPYPACLAAPTGHGDPLDDEQAMQFWLHSCIANARYEHFGKPIVVQEFGWYGGGESHFLCPLPYRSEQEHADYTRRLVDTLAPHVNGFVNWPTMDMPSASDISNHGGIFTSDARPKALAAVYEQMARDLSGTRHVRPPATTTMQVSLLGLFTCRSYQDQMWDEVHEVIQSGEIPDFRFV
jgi:hypothetical protein